MQQTKFPESPAEFKGFCPKRQTSIASINLWTSRKEQKEISIQLNYPINVESLLSSDIIRKTMEKFSSVLLRVLDVFVMKIIII